ncbi:MAG TPA: DUF4202 family protein [Kofleriaceae bacterium]|nr:DUF4202 family protein [Kofleriaceae bacterium]
MPLEIMLDTAADRAAAPEVVTAEAWRDDGFDFWAFDRRLDTLVARGEPLRVRAPAALAPAVLSEIRTRGQRLAPRRTPATAGAWFDRVLDAHRALHDLARPLVRADYDHALDAWQWAVRRDRDAPAAVQLAVLLHDIERLVSEADARHEHLAADYQAFKDAHARAGAQIARGVLARAGVGAALVDEVCALIAVHERPSADPALRAINDADALSFFSFNSPGYLAYFGPDKTRGKVAYTLARMSPAARDELAALRMPAAIRAAIAELRAGHGDQPA